MVLVWQVTYLVLYLFLMLLLGRLVMEYVLVFARRWQPGRGAAAFMELVWSTTDPPLRALRRVIPPLRIGSVSLDLGFLLLLMIVSVLMSVVGRQISALLAA
ncbi:MAG TPA: YggT family protein [Cryptosporangiaceae bacterium]|nr:YggT family protein [Cryptosporangiaceae bacterium]